MGKQKTMPNTVAIPVFALALVAAVTTGGLASMIASFVCGWAVVDVAINIYRGRS